MKRRGFEIIKPSKGERSKHLEWKDAISDMGQNWSKDQYNEYPCIKDQYQFMIVSTPNGNYDLYLAGEYVITTHTINGAKFISLILLNEKILKS